MGRFISVVALQLQGLIPAVYKNRQDWWRSSVTLLLGDWMVLVTWVSWLGLDWFVSLLGLETLAESDLRKRRVLTRWNGGIAQGWCNQ